MTPAAAKPLEPLQQLFPTFEAFIAGTMEHDVAKLAVKQQPNKFKYAYGVRRLNPATGKMESRYLLREHTTREIMDKLKGAPASTAERITQNGVKQPSPTSVAHAVWAALDNLLVAGNNAPLRHIDIGFMVMQNGWKLSNVMTECSLWRKFNGYTWKVVK